MIDRPFVVTGARITHDRASLDTLEAAAHPDPEARLEELAGRDGVAEAFVLGTCNRVEEYVVTETADAGREALSGFAPDAPDAAVVTTGHTESLRHLLRVAAGLESQVLGEDEVLGQVRRAYARAQRAGAIGPVLEAGVLKAIHVGERARSETAINEGIVSLGSAAAELADRERGLDGRTVLVVGAGEMAESVARSVADADVGDMWLVNRSIERAERLAADLPGDVRTDGLGALADGVREADVVITSTGSDAPVIDAGTAAGAGETLVIDLAQPRDVAPDAREAPDVAVRDLEALRAVTESTHEDRREAAAAVEAIVDEELDLLIEEYKRKRADAVIAGMYRGAERIKRRELETALSKLDGIDADDREVVESLADALVSQLLAVPTESLRDAAAEDDWETITAAIDLFEPGVDDPAEFFSAAVEGAPADAADE